MATTYHSQTLMAQLAPKLPIPSTYSGYSILSVLSSLFQATSGDSRAQLGKFLGLTPDQEYWEMMTQLRQKLSYSGEMNAVDFLVSADAFPIRDDFRKSSTGCLEIISEKDPSQIRQVVNDKVAEVTRNLIPEFLQESDADESTVLMLVNAMSFQSQWLFPFDPKETQKRDFTTLEGETLSLDTMYQYLDRGFRYSQNDRFQYLEMPYGAYSEKDNKIRVSEYVMQLVLPKDSAHLSDLTQPEVINELRIPARDKEVHVYLPKFTQRTRLSLKPILENLGLKDLIDSCELGQLTEGPPLPISNVIHETVLTVDEYKTEGAAASGIGFNESCRGISWPATFRADRPFYYQVMHDRTNMPILSGVFNGSS